MKTAVVALSMVGAASAFVTPMGPSARGRAMKMSFDAEPGKSIHDED